MVNGPTTAASSLIYYPTSWVEHLSLPAMFRTERPLEVELGSGDGSFMARWAAQRPDHNFLAVERLLGRLRKLDRKAQRASLANLRLMRIEAAYFLEYLLPHRSTAALHLYFPDPWPKRKHRRNRLVNERFPELVARILIPEGICWLRTDDEDYFHQMLEVFAADKRFFPIETPAELAAVTTDFERGFNQRGIPTQRAGYKLRLSH